MQKFYCSFGLVIPVWLAWALRIDRPPHTSMPGIKTREGSVGCECSERVGLYEIIDDYKAICCLQQAFIDKHIFMCNHIDCMPIHSLL